MQDGGWSEALKGAGLRLRRLGRGVADLILPPMAHDSPAATASAGLTPGAWSRVVFLEAPVCDGCGAAFEADGGVFAADRCAACTAQPYAFGRARAACVYDENSRDLILRFKHGDQQQFGKANIKHEASIVGENGQSAPAKQTRVRIKLGTRAVANRSA